MKISCLLFALLLSVAFSLSAAADDLLPQGVLTQAARTTPPAPEAAALARATSVEVNHAAGTASLSVPLVEWRIGDNAVSLALGYVTEAVRVRDEAGLTGLGWSLAGLGRISRSIAGKPDSKGLKLDYRKVDVS